MKSFIKCMYNLLIFIYIINLLNSGYFTLLDTIILLLIAMTSVCKFINILDV